MKITKYIAALAIVSFFTSCEQDDEVAVAGQTKNIQVVVAPFGTLAVTDIVGQLGTNSADVDFGFKLTNATTYFDSDVKVTYQGQDYIIHPEDADNDGVIDPESLEVIIGVSTVEFEIQAPAGGIPYNGSVSTAQIDLSDTEYDLEIMPIGSRPNELVVLKGAGASLSVNATVYGQLPAITPGQINFLFDWDPNNDAGNDLDLRVRRMPGDVGVDYSGSVSNYESVDISDTAVASEYEVKADAWSTIGGTISGIVFAMHPDGTLEVFETDLTGIAAGGVSAEVVLLKVTKGVDAISGDVTYTLYQ